MEETELSIRSWDHNLCAALNEDEYDRKYAVVMCHGWSRDKNGSKYLMLRDTLEKRKIASLRFDFYGHGDSDGELNQFDAEIGVTNITSAVNYLRNLGYQKRRIGVVGSCAGGEYALLYAAENRIGALVLREPTHDERVEEKSKSIVSPTLIIQSTGKGVNVTETMKEMSQFSMNFMEELVHNLRCDNELKFIGGDHSCSNAKSKEEFVKLSSEWFSRWLKDKHN